MVLATMMKYRLEQAIAKYGTDVEILNTGDIMICEDTGSIYQVLEILYTDTLCDTDGGDTIKLDKSFLNVEALSRFNNPFRPINKLTE